MVNQKVNHLVKLMQRALRSCFFATAVSIILCIIKVQNGLTFWYQVNQVVLGLIYIRLLLLLHMHTTCSQSPGSGFTEELIIKK